MRSRLHLPSRPLAVQRVAWHHGIGTRSMMSSITVSAVMPWLVACGPSQMRWPRTYFARSCMSSGYTSSRSPHEQRPHLHQAPPADRRARRRAEIDVCSTISDGERCCQSVSALYGRVAPTRRRMYLPSFSCRNTSRVMSAAQLDDPLLRHQRVEPHLLEIEIHQLLLFLGRQVADVHHDGEPIGRRFRQRKRALPELHRVHRRDREAERRQLVGRLADGDLAILQPFEKRALRLQRDAVDLVEQDDFRRGERTELGDELRRSPG